MFQLHTTQGMSIFLASCTIGCLDGCRRCARANQKTSDLQKASVAHVSKIKLKLRYHGIHFRLFTMWRVPSTGFHTLSAPKLTQKMRQTVLFLSDSTGSAWIFESGRTRRHRFIYIALCVRGPIGICIS